MVCANLCTCIFTCTAYQVFILNIFIGYVVARAKQLHVPLMKMRDAWIPLVVTYLITINYSWLKQGHVICSSDFTSSILNLTINCANHSVIAPILFLF